MMTWVMNTRGRLTELEMGAYFSLYKLLYWALNHFLCYLWKKLNVIVLLWSVKHFFKIVDPYEIFGKTRRRKNNNVFLSGRRKWVIWPKPSTIIERPISFLSLTFVDFHRYHCRMEIAKKIELLVCHCFQIQVLYLINNLPFLWGFNFEVFTFPWCNN